MTGLTRAIDFLRHLKHECTPRPQSSLRTTNIKLYGGILSDWLCATTRDFGRGHFVKDVKCMAGNTKRDCRDWDRIRGVGWHSKDTANTIGRIPMTQHRLICGDKQILNGVVVTPGAAQPTNIPSIEHRDLTRWVKQNTDFLVTPLGALRLALTKYHSAADGPGTMADPT